VIKKTTYNDLKVEVQLRSVFQHAWDTAVETVGTFAQQALKSSQGQEDWLEFFKLMASEIALREKCPHIPGTPQKRQELRSLLREYSRKLDVENHLSLYADALQAPEEAGTVKGAHYFLLELDGGEHKLKITAYKNDELERASKDYLAVEQNGRIAQARCGTGSATTGTHASQNARWHPAPSRCT
jgi:hypothetical protein